MTNYERGTLVLVSILFSDQSGLKKRPAVVVSSEEYHSSRDEVIIAAVTGRVREDLLFGDCKIEGWKAAGLLKASVATSIVWTVKGGAIGRKLGSLSNLDLKRFDKVLAGSLGIKP